MDDGDMADNNDRRQQKTVWDILPVLVVLGSLITAWVNLNGDVTQVKIQQGYNEKYNTVQYENLTQDIEVLRNTLDTVKETTDNTAEQITDLERAVTQLYRKKR